jgi:hypothetical protein
MSETPTPGQTCYEVFLGARYPQPSTFRDMYSPWEEIAPEAQYAWETAAQAVLAAALAARVWARQAPSSRWQVVPQPQEDAP